ncbi:MAG: chemotaxis-specific protein-glutamate methyltransferase CheB [Firmicutes bacterium]|nr:chemotaxis-specific protein-glutamate methyltransferase CheB [Bacillota bacterium]
MPKLLIADDSALMRRHLTDLFAEAGDFTIQTARHGAEAVEANRVWQPDVVILDINMPVMDGLTALAMMMIERPVPVVMLSSLTHRGALATFEALNLGALDYVPKPDGTISLSLDRVKEELIAKVRAAARVRHKWLKATPDRHAVGHPSPAKGRQALPQKGCLFRGLVVIGVSTGGPRTLEAILPELPASLGWAVLVAQHMPAEFSRAFAERMDRQCALKVVEVCEPVTIQPDTIYIGQGGKDMRIGRRGAEWVVFPRPQNEAFLWHPSVDDLVESVLQHWDPTRTIGVLLTGMGYDGAEAMARLRKRGGLTIAESESTAVVFGMPHALIERGGASVVLPAHRIAAQIAVWTKRDEAH